MVHANFLRDQKSTTFGVNETKDMGQETLGFGDIDLNKGGLKNIWTNPRYKLGILKSRQ